MTTKQGMIKIVIMPNLEHLIRKSKMKLTKRQERTVSIIGRWADGHCTHSKAKVTNKQLADMGILVFVDEAVVLTELGRKVYNKLK
jgi:hypothetical protein